MPFTFEQGKIYGLIGRNGAGKTTLFNCLSNEIQHDAGEAKLVIDGNERDLNLDDISYVLSSPILPDFLTGYEFIKFMMDINEERMDPLYTAANYLTMVKIEQDDWHRLSRTIPMG